MIRRFIVVLLMLMLVPIVLCKDVKAEPSRQRVIFLCEKQEYASNSTFIEFTLKKRAMGYETIIEVKPELFVDSEKLRKWLGEQQYFLVYTVGNIDFFKTRVKNDLTYPIENIQWDAPYWWPRFKFQYVYESNLPDSIPNILARIPVSSVEELESWLLIKGIVSKEIVATVTATNVMNTQNSKLFSHFQYDNIANYDEMKKVKGLFNNAEFLVEKRGINSLSISSKDKQIDKKSFVDSMQKSNLAILTSTAEPISEFYYEKKDSLLVVPGASNSLSSSYIEIERNSLVKEEFCDNNNEINGNNRVIIIQNFYNKPNDLNMLMKMSRCIVTMNPNWIGFYKDQSNLGNLQFEIVSKLLKGELLVNAISESIINWPIWELVVWGDPLVDIQDLIFEKPVKVINAGFARDIVYQISSDISFSNLPDTLTVEKKNGNYVFHSTIPVTAFFFNKSVIINGTLLFEFKEKDQKGWVFFRIKIFNFGGLQNPPFFICI